MHDDLTEISQVLGMSKGALARALLDEAIPAFAPVFVAVAEAAAAQKEQLTDEQVLEILEAALARHVTRSRYLAAG